MAKKKPDPIVAEEAQEQTDLKAFAAADDASATVPSPPSVHPPWTVSVDTPASIPVPDVPFPVDDTVTISAFKPSKGDFRVVVAIIGDQGHERHVDFTIGPDILPNLTERWMWDRYFYPALLALKGTV